MLVYSYFAVIVVVGTVYIVIIIHRQHHHYSHYHRKHRLYNKRKQGSEYGHWKGYHFAGASAHCCPHPLFQKEGLLCLLDPQWVSTSRVGGGSKPRRCMIIPKVTLSNQRSCKSRIQTSGWSNLIPQIPLHP